MPRFAHSHSGRRRAALLLSATTLTILVACSDRTPAADAASASSTSTPATPAAAYAEARAARYVEGLETAGVLPAPLRSR